MNNWYYLDKETKIGICNNIAEQMAISSEAVEKDWWVSFTLNIVFQMSCANHLLFKGGTSLSKAWNLIERFSEDIDLALDRRHLGFSDDLSISQIKKLRSKSFNYVSTSFYPEFQSRFNSILPDVADIRLAEVRDTDQDPIIIEIYYPSIMTNYNYLKPRVMLEIGCRSLAEPFTKCAISSLISKYYSTHTFIDTPINIPVVNPERTFLEKIFLLHEEFQKPFEKIRVDRLSRHLYDIERIMDTEFAEKALRDKNLYAEIVKHRSRFTSIRGIDYANHTPSKINPIPPDNVIKEWEKDYKLMQQNMIYGKSLSFSLLINRITLLKERLNQMEK